MDAFLGFLVIAWFIWRAVRFFAGLTAGTTVGGANMGALEGRITDTQTNENEDGLAAKVLETRGVFPVRRRRQVAFWTSVFDSTGEELEPIVSLLSDWQEPDTTVFRNTREAGVVGPDQGFVEWTPVGSILPDFLQPPFGGRRKITAVLRLVDSENPPAISHGYHQPDDTGILWQTQLDFEYEFNEKGYQEVAEHREEAQALSIKIAIAVAMADGAMDRAEGETLKQWITKVLEPYGAEKRNDLRKMYDAAFKQAYAEAKAGDQVLSTLTQRLNEIGERKVKVDAIELCFEVMTADGVIDAGETELVNHVADALGLDGQTLAIIRDGALTGKDIRLDDQSSVESLLNIDPEWSPAEIKRHLRDEFGKWSGRLNTLAEGPDRDHAQFMLDKISEARTKYAT